MEPLETLALLDAKLDEHGLRAKGWRGGLDEAVRRFGCCHLRERRITVSRPLAALNSDAEVLDTVLHEIAHALALIDHGEDCGHDERWRVIATRIGARPARCFDAEEVATPAARYLLVHRDTGEVFRSYHRRPRLTDLSRRWSRGRRPETEGRLAIVTARELAAAGPAATREGGARATIPLSRGDERGRCDPFDREGVRALTERITAAIEAICGETGGSVDLEVCHFAPDVLHCTFTIRKEGVDLEAEERAAFARDCPLFLLSADAYGKGFDWSGEHFTLCGLKPRSPKYPVLGRDATGRRFKFPLAALDGLRPFTQ